MKEEFLHYVWQYKLFSQGSLTTSKDESLTVIKSGIWNRNSGPDFLFAQLKINDKIWVGHVEIHVKSSDWYGHQHEVDCRYDAVILHVVYEVDMPVFIRNNQHIPTLILRDKINAKLQKSYKRLLGSHFEWVPCEKQLRSVTSFVLKNWFERLYIERLERNVVFIKQVLNSNRNDFEETLFQLLFKSFGLKVNGDTFFELSKSLKFSILRKERYDLIKLSALVFGQAGFLQGTLEGSYRKRLRDEYTYLARKYNLQPMQKMQFQFFRMRPLNFPTIRLAQLVFLYHSNSNLFSKLITNDDVSSIYDTLRSGVDEFWKTHYTFETQSKKSDKFLTKRFIDLLIINAIVPLQFVYTQSKGAYNSNRILKTLEALEPEKNSIIANFSKYSIEVKNAKESQALLELKTMYCNYKHCLNCSIGNSLLKNGIL